jgi:hypothetical protein
VAFVVLDLLPIDAECERKDGVEPIPHRGGDPSSFTVGSSCVRNQLQVRAVAEGLFSVVGFGPEPAL